MEFYLLILFESARYILPAALLVLLITKHPKAELGLKSLLWAIVSLDFLIEFSGILIQETKESGIILMHMYSLIHPLLVMGLFYIAFNRAVFKKLILALGVSFTLFVSYLFSTLGMTSLYTAPYVVGQIIILVLCVTYFFNLISEMKVKSLKHHYFFWINSALFIYHGSTYFVSLFEATIREQQSLLFDYSWQIQLWASILFIFILILGTWTTRLRSY